MSAALMLTLGAVITATSFLSGVFGMAGGLILVGVLLALMPLPAAMALHAVTQIASNLWRGALWWRHIAWRAAWPYLAGSALAMVGWTLTLYVPSKPVALLMLGVTPFLVRLLPTTLRPDPFSLPQGLLYGACSMVLLLLTGVSGPLVDTFFLGGKPAPGASGAGSSRAGSSRAGSSRAGSFGNSLSGAAMPAGGALDRREIVATKAVCQVFGHAAKLAYFGGIITNAAGLDPLMAGLAVGCAMLGTTLARRLLEALTDLQYRRWANRLITAIAGYYVVQGSIALFGPMLATALSAE